MKKRAGLMALIAAICVSCGPTPRPSSSQPVPETSANSPAGSVASPIRSTPTPQALVAHDIPQSLTTPLLDVTTDGSQIIWSKGTPGSTVGAPYLYEYTPGQPSPSIVYSDSDKTATVSPIAVSSSGYAFVEQFSRGGADIGWRLFYLPHSGQRPISVETSETDPASFNGLIPQITLTKHYLVWTAVHDVNGNGQFYLRAYSIDTGQITTLQTSPANLTEYWFPSGDATDRLVYSTVERSAPGSEAAFHVYFLPDLASLASQPVRLDSDGGGTNPVISGDTVVWKQVMNNVTNYGNALVVHSLSSRQARQEKLPDQPFVTTLSVGDRYVANWGMDAAKLVLFDLVTGKPFDLYNNPSTTSSPAYVRPVVAGDVLVFISGSIDPSVPLQLSWMYLPPRP
jgi:hypothetical protein